ncbi:hypothetical protein GCM10009347_27500 [Shewanella algicola]|uniref:Uncharacterized protein n=1 Tax=Shewanella algicola TaxID=640633 RepID=A0A9X1Z5D6_9GAMM|nr:hypothetical protein [Shewanella algicola]MCL1106531.1 hypothetical protein [Shewanella algicola]GGP59566.1 hypothetical protein GCM10009347_27500 [Shewanella algicola]
MAHKTHFDHGGKSQKFVKLVIKHLTIEQYRHSPFLGTNVIEIDNGSR